jgi:hypothetical protein
VDHNSKKQQKLKLLTDVSGVIIPAKMTALVCNSPPCLRKYVILPACGGSCGQDLHLHLQMGPSGSGKTTLLGDLLSHALYAYMQLCCQSASAKPGWVAAPDVLAGRKTTGEVSGLVLVGGKPPSRMFMRRYTGYVEQFGARPGHTSSHAGITACSAFSGKNVLLPDMVQQRRPL